VAIVYLGLGTNLGDRAANLRAALAALPPDFDVQAVSRCYETEPAYVLDQPRFLNLAARAATGLEPLAALRRLKALEAELGRARGRRFGPRLIDLDLLVYDNVMLDTPELTLPHPRLHERAFVLVPLADLDPALAPPGLGATVARLRDRLGDTARQIWPAPECDLALQAP
jgi:2-amino-4-hydroxy-6-hydroxymethyldihydropteridine diphosphokinase